MAQSNHFSFPVLHDTKPDDTTLPAFMVSTERGFLPRQNPIVDLPEEFDPLESILARMPIKTLSGEPGLLATFDLGPEVEKHLPDLSDAVDKYKSDLPLMNALYRDYSFLASAYLLEPCHERFMRKEPYGLGRQSLPRSIAVPITKVAEAAGFMPFMEYAGSYALFNYRLMDPARGLEYDNLRLIRAFELGLDPKSSEAGFVLVHIAMVKHSGKMVSGVVESLEGALGADREIFNAGMFRVIDALEEINKTMHTMWTRSKPSGYTSFRTFIFGITSQSMFPDGVIYEGISEEPMSFRGESGANDSIIPTMDNLLQITMPETPLTQILQDFRKYRPGNHRDFLEAVKVHADKASVKDFALADPVSASLYLRALDQVRAFRWRHWTFTVEYILKNTSHPVATGGSPIVTWLPNQLQAVLSSMIDTEKHCEDVKGTADIMDVVRMQQDNLTKEVAKYCSERNAA